METLDPLSRLSIRVPEEVEGRQGQSMRNKTVPNKFANSGQRNCHDLYVLITVGCGVERPFGSGHQECPTSIVLDCCALDHRRLLLIEAGCGIPEPLRPVTHPSGMPLPIPRVRKRLLGTASPWAHQRF